MDNCLPKDQILRPDLSPDKAADVWLALRKLADENLSIAGEGHPFTSMEKKLYDALTMRLAVDATLVFATSHSREILE